MNAKSISSGILTTVAVAIALGVGLTLGAGAVLLLKSGVAGGPPAGGGGGGEAMGGAPPASVVVGDARSLPLRQRFGVVGRLQAIQRAVISAEVEGKLLELPVEAGDAVDAGKTLLAKIEDVWAKMTLAEARAQVESASATLDQSKRDYEYLSSLSSSGAAKPKEVDDARAKVESGQADLDAAIAARDRATEQLSRVTITAPFDGWVVAKQAEVGERVEPGDPLVELVSRGQIDAVVDVPEQVINQITVGDQAEVVIDAQGRIVLGEVVKVNPDGQNAARTYAVKVRLSDEGGALKPGMSVTARLPLEKTTPRLTVPRDAVQFGTQGPVVWVAAPNGEGPPTAAQVPVQVLFGHESTFAVQPAPGPLAEALHDGAKVVVQGAEMIFFPGQPLTLTESAEPTEPAQAQDGQSSLTPTANAGS